MNGTKSDIYINMSLSLPGGGKYYIDDEVDIMPAFLSADLKPHPFTYEHGLDTLQNYLVHLFGKEVLSGTSLNLH